jgi:hypothetical protein
VRVVSHAQLLNTSLTLRSHTQRNDSASISYPNNFHRQSYFIFVETWLRFVVDLHLSITCPTYTVKFHLRNSKTHSYINRTH